MSQLDTYEQSKQFFGFHPLSFVDDVINAASEYCCDGTDALEEFLKQHVVNMTEQQLSEV